MTISLTTTMANGRPLFVSNPAGPNFTQLHIDMINRNPAALAVYVAAAANNTPYTIGKAGEGTYYDTAMRNGPIVSVVIDPNDFSLVKTPAGSTAQTTAQNQLSNAANVVNRGVHEGAHVIDHKDGTPIPGVTANYASPGEYATARAPTEGQSIASEARADYLFIGQTYTINGVPVTYTGDTYVVGGNASTTGGYNDMDNRLHAVYSNTTLTAAQQTSTATAIATSANLTAIASTSGGTYLDTNMRDYAAHWSGLPTNRISSVTQDDSGHWSVTAVTGTDSITRSYSPIETGQTSPTITSERTTSVDIHGFRVEVVENFETGITTRQSFDIDNNLYQRTTSLTNATGTKVVTTEDYVPNVAAPVKVTTTEDVGANGTIDRTTTRVDADRNGIAESIQTLTRSATGQCSREDYAVSPVGLPSTTSYTFRAGFDSELASKEVVSTAGNGLVSRVLSEFDAQSHITLANSVLAANADLSGRTTIAQQANGTWVQDAWHYNAAGSATGHELSHLRANQSMADITAYDALGQAALQPCSSDDNASVAVVGWHRLAANQSQTKRLA
jgi:hypothetical protein